MTKKGDEITETRPSYGTVQISRMTGLQRLVGSMLDECPSAVVFRVFHAQKHVDPTLHTERFWHKGLPIIEFRMSPHQFAEAITGMGASVEIPMTIRYLNGEEIDPPTGDDTPIERIAKDARLAARLETDGSSAMSEELDDLIGYIRSLKITNKLRDDLVARVGNLRAHTEAPVRAVAWAAEQLARAASEAVSQAKAEVGAAIVDMATRMGLRQLAGLPPHKAQAAIIGLAQEDEHEQR